MSLAFRLKMAKRRGEALVSELGIRSLPVDPFAIAESRGIVVKAKPDAAAGVSGMLLRHDDTFGILYATHVSSEGFQRFSVAHELGHYFLDGHIDQILPTDGYHASHAGFVSADPYEGEADNFAAGLLMPSDLFRQALRDHEPGVTAVEAAAHLCGTSLTATAIRYAELTDDAVAIVVSTGRRIDYCCLSATMKSLPQITWLRSGSSVPLGTATAQLNSDPTRIARANRAESDIDIRDWLDGTRSVRGIEEVIGLGSYGKTLTVLTCPSLVDETYQEDDVEDEESLIDRWTPRFRR